MGAPTDFTGSPSTTVAIILALSGLGTGLGSAWLNKRPGRRRTEPSSAGKDLLSAHSRIDVMEQNAAEKNAADRERDRRLDRIEITFDVSNEETDRRLNRLEDRP